MSKKLVKYALIAGGAYLAVTALKKSGALSGLGLGDDDLSMSLPADVVPPSIYYGNRQPYFNTYGGYPYQPAYQPQYPYFNAQYQLPPPQQYTYYGPGVPQAPGFQFNPFGGRSDPWGSYIPKIITPSGGIGGVR